MNRNFWFACKAGIGGTPAVDRCRNEEGKCSSHPAGHDWPTPPKANVVLLKTALNDRWLTMFDEAVTIENRTWGERRRMEAQRVAQAESIGRQAYGARLDPRSQPVPENADSGCPVFGKTSGGLKSVSVKELATELQAAGYVLTGASILQMEGTQTDARAGIRRPGEGVRWFPVERFQLHGGALSSSSTSGRIPLAPMAW